MSFCYFNAKIEQIYSDTSYQNCNTLDVDINKVKSSCASKFRKFEPLSLAGLKATIESMPSQTCRRYYVELSKLQISQNSFFSIFIFPTKAGYFGPTLVALAALYLQILNSSNSRILILIH